MIELYIIKFSLAWGIIMKRFIAQNKFTFTAIVFDILTIIAVLLYFLFDISELIAIALGVLAIVLNVLVKRNQKKKLNSKSINE